MNGRSWISVALIVMGEFLVKNDDGGTVEALRSWNGSLKLRSSLMETSGGGKRAGLNSIGMGSESRCGSITTGRPQNDPPEEQTRRWQTPERIEYVGYLFRPMQAHTARYRIG
jgi:hypothetical protein